MVKNDGVESNILVINFGFGGRENIFPNNKYVKKWFYPTRNIAVGDVVLMKESSSRKDWPLAVVTKTISSNDGLIRRVILRLRRNSSSSNKPKFLERSVHDLVLIVPTSNSAPPECHGKK